MRRVLWMKGGGLGDFILGLPVLSALRGAFPSSRLEAVGPGAWLPLASGWADALEPLEAPVWAALYGNGEGLATRLHEIDLAVVLRPDPDGLVSRNLTEAGVAKVLVRSPAPRQGVHQADHLCRVLEPLKITCSGLTGISLPEADTRPGEREGGVVIHPGSGGSAKLWPRGRFWELAETLIESGRRTSIILGPVEHARGDAEFWERTRARVLTLDSIRELIGFLGTARVYVGNDSGVSHLAAALGCVSVVLFGPTDPLVWAPRGEWVQVVTAARDIGGGGQREARGASRARKSGPADADARRTRLERGRALHGCGSATVPARDAVDNRARAGNLEDISPETVFEIVEDLWRQSAER